MRESSDILSAKILIVDDQESNVRLLEHTLRRGGYLAVSSTTASLEVCALHAENRYDLILLDIQMPRMNGFEVLKALRESEGANGVAILVITADPAEMVRALEAGATGFLSKPFVLAEVLRRVFAMLDLAGDQGVTVVEVPTTAGTLRQSTGRITRNVDPLPGADPTST